MPNSGGSEETRPTNSAVEATCELTLKLIPIGWMKIDLKIGPHQRRLSVSYMEAGPAEMILALVAFFNLGTSQSVYFECEPGNPVLRLDWTEGSYRISRRASGNVRIRIGHEYEVASVGWEDMYHPSPSEDIFDVVCDVFAFRDAFFGALIKVFDELGVDEINNRWNSDPPLNGSVSDAHHWLLKDAILRHREEWGR